jgi:hypothetical protein
MLEEGTVKIIKELDSGHPVLISVKEGFNTNKENHLVLIIGYDFSGENPKFIVHDPDGLNKTDLHSEMPVEIAKIHEFWRKFAIFSYI